MQDYILKIGVQMICNWLGDCECPIVKKRVSLGSRSELGESGSLTGAFLYVFGYLTEKQHFVYEKHGMRVGFMCSGLRF